MLLVALLCWDLQLGRIDGVVLFSLLMGYLALLFAQRRETNPTAEAESGTDEEVRPKPPLWRSTALLFLGLGSVLGASHLLVGSATTIARHLGVSEWVIAVTVIAAGTSAPEVATSLAGVLKGRHAIAAGNVIGSDIFNLLGVLGLAGILRPVEIDPMARISLFALAAMVLLAVLFMRTGWRISRTEGLALVAVAFVRWGFDFSAHAPPECPVPEGGAQNVPNELYELRRPADESAARGVDSSIPVSIEDGSSVRVIPWRIEATTEMSLPLITTRYLQRPAGRGRPDASVYRRVDHDYVRMA